MVINMNREDKQDHELSEHLHNVTSAGIMNDDRKNLNLYTKLSSGLNGNLLSGKPLNPTQKNIHGAILRHAKPTGVDFDVYSGTGNKNFAELAKKSKDGILHSPAHISATHAKHVADEFAFNVSKERHMIKIAVHHKDPVLHVSRLSHYQDEHETIIPAGTKLKYSHSEEGTFDKRHLFGGKPVQIHHFTIHREGINESAEFRERRIHNDSKHLYSTTNRKLSPIDRDLLDEYKTSSSALNKHLIHNDYPPEDNPNIHRDLASAHYVIKKHAKPIGKHMHFYSGTSTDFGNIARHSKDHILHSHAHISATHDLDVARGFAEIRNTGGPKHIVHIKAEPHHKGLNVSNPDDMYDNEERETIIPAGTKLKWSHSTKHKIDGEIHHIHHFKIHSQGE